jgi:transcriptional regulator with XRE-family HTH domain
MLRRTNQPSPSRAPVGWGGGDGARRTVSAPGAWPARMQQNLQSKAAKSVASGPTHTAPAVTCHGVARHAEARVEVMRLLRGIRVAQGLSEAVLAARLGTSQRLIIALEKGDLASLPDWSETHRIVDRWVAGAGLDPRPALGSLATALEGYVAPGSPNPTAKSEPSAGFVGATLRKLKASAVGVDGAKSARKPFRLSLKFGLPPSRVARWTTVALIAAAIGTTATQTSVVAGALSKLPAPAERAVRTISDYFAVRFAPLYEGHRWINVEDPRSRRGDKLRIGRHSD